MAPAWSTCPGNHDEFARAYCGGESSGDLEFADEVVHEAADGKKYLVLHGDVFDPVQSKARCWPSSATTPMSPRSASTSS